jgi:hypothetical protein
MNQINSKIGITSSIIIMIGCLLKAFHLQGTGALISLGFLLFSLVFIPTLVYSQLKDKKIIYALGFFFTSTLMLGVLFKVMHWPYANFLISWSVTIALFAIMPLYFITTYSNKINEEFTKEDRTRKVFIGVFIVAFLSMWYLMIDIQQIPSPYSIP